MRALWLAAVLWSGAAFAQEAPKDAKSAIELARAAFEFRDFQKVVDVLDIVGRLEITQLGLVTQRIVK